jgi:hypothetical protein
MSFERTIKASVPAPSQGREWLATALLEAPGPDGPWTAIEATEGAVEELATRHAVHADGWYRLQWYDDGQVSKFSTPVQHGNTAASRLR